MNSLNERVKQLETDLRSSPMRHYIYSDLPFAIFCYRPGQEWEMRGEIRRLKTRLEKVRKVEVISLADLMWQSINESEGLNAVQALERESGFLAAQTQVSRYLSDRDWNPLRDLLKGQLDALLPSTQIAFIVRAGALSPNVYRVSKLLDEMKGRTRLPCVLFLPATTEGQTNMKYMGIAENEARGSYHTKVYTE